MHKVPIASQGPPDWACWGKRIDRVTQEYLAEGMSPKASLLFRTMVYDFYREHGRHDLPWRNTDDPYNIVVSEIMLQQTQVTRVVSKYQDFIDTFPDWEVLANAPLPHILSVWQGMGYNRRALALKHIAQQVVVRFQRKVPGEVEVLMTLPGIGRATAGALCAFIHHLPVVFIETNIRAAFLHCFYAEQVSVSDQEVCDRIAQTMDQKNPRDWYQALMDLGVCIKAHMPNPNRISAGYRKQSILKGSDREIRGRIVAVLLKDHVISEQKLYRMLKCSKKRLKYIIRRLINDGLVDSHGSYIRIRQ